MTEAGGRDHIGAGISKVATLRRSAVCAFVRLADETLIWFTVAFGYGCLAYFGLAREPAWVTLVVWTAIPGIAVVVCRRDATLIRFACIVGFAVCIGVVWTKLRSDLLDAPMLDCRHGPATVEG
ncbi:MAG: hypothetical protein AAFX39_17060, partial [Pseudomonadota bacterium]